MVGVRSYDPSYLPNRSRHLNRFESNMFLAVGMVALITDSWHTSAIDPTHLSYYRFEIGSNSSRGNILGNDSISSMI